MLIEMASPVFKEKGKVRPPICFKEGLNVILGKENGENSIGKSSAMLAIDFIFGGSAYISSDGVKHMDHHVINFTFQFGGTKYRFSRNTAAPNEIVVCGEDYKATEEVWTKEEYVNWLKEKYGMDFPGVSFRNTISSFFRIYGKDNLDERRPLKGHQGQSMEDSIEMLVTLFNRYGDIEVFSARLDEQKEKLKAFRAARKFNFISDLVGGKTKYEENLKRIADLELELDNLTEEQVEDYSEEEVEKSRKKSQLKDQKLKLESDIQSRQRRLRLLDMSLEYGLYPTEADMSELQEYFPGVNLRKLYEVEKYHKKLAEILDLQFEQERSYVTEEISGLQKQADDIQAEIRKIGFSGNISKEFLDRHSEITGEIRALRDQNSAYLTEKELEYARKKADDLLKQAITDILHDIEAELNDKMSEFNNALYEEARKAPRVTFNAYNSYRFETPDDTGTGSNYKGMVIYDLSVLYTTALPAIAHDSLILKNISDTAIDGIMKIYQRSEKQVFIAFDKQAAYLPDTQTILEDHAVLKLSDNGSELYGESWNKEETSHENEL